MGRENCPHAYRKQGDVSVHCKKQNSKQDYCIGAYYCNNSKRYEADKKSKSCRFRQGE